MVRENDGRRLAWPAQRRIDGIPIGSSERCDFALATVCGEESLRALRAGSRCRGGLLELDTIGCSRLGNKAPNQGWCLVAVLARGT
jgi:hypothetical protein